MSRNPNEYLIRKLRDGKVQEIVLRKDLVIKRGTVFQVAPTVTRREGEGHFAAEIGLTKDTSGTVSYSIDPSAVADLDKLLNEWFIVI